MNKKFKSEEKICIKYFQSQKVKLNNLIYSHTQNYSFKQTDGKTDIKCLRSYSFKQKVLLKGGQFKLTVIRVN